MIHINRREKNYVFTCFKGIRSLEIVESLNEINDILKESGFEIKMSVGLPKSVEPEIRFKFIFYEDSDDRKRTEIS